jgi:tetratricopeptide (TPR) repeat protein
LLYTLLRDLDRKEVKHALDEYLAPILFVERRSASLIQGQKRPDGQYDDVYIMHDLVYQVSQAECMENDNDRLAGLHACLTYVERHFIVASPKLLNPDRFRAIHAARLSIIGAVKYAIDFAERKQDIQIQNAVIRLMFILVDGKYFEAKGYQEQWVSLLEESANLALGAQMFREAHWLNVKAANAYASNYSGVTEEEEYLRNLEIAQGRYALARESAEKIVDPNEARRRTAISHSLLGTVYCRIGKFYIQNDKFDDAVQCFDGAVQCFKNAETFADEDLLTLSQIREHQGHYLIATNDEAQALTYFQQSVELAHRADVSHEGIRRLERLFYDYINCSEMALRAADYPRSLSYVGDAMECADKLNSDELRARAWLEFANKYSEAGQRAYAVHAVEEAMRFYGSQEDEGLVDNEALRQEALELASNIKSLTDQRWNSLWTNCSGYGCSFSALDDGPTDGTGF